MSTRVTALSEKCRAVQQTELGITRWLNTQDYGTGDILVQYRHKLGPCRAAPPMRYSSSEKIWRSGIGCFFGRQTLVSNENPCGLRPYNVTAVYRTSAFSTSAFAVAHTPAHGNAFAPADADTAAHTAHARHSQADGTLVAAMPLHDDGWGLIHYYADT